MEKSLIKVALWVALMVTFCFKQSFAGGTDSTIVPGGNGVDVVHATIAKIAQVEQGSQLLLPDDRLLLRIAWVETEYGTAQGTYSDPDYHGGIWRVDRDMFDLTRIMYNRNEFAEIFEEVSTVLQISWILATWEDCRQPLYSGLAARLFLHNANTVIPPGWAVQQQATYWQDYYPHNPPTGTVMYFSQKVAEIPGCTNKGIDLVFVIDGSGSVGAADFSTSKTFVQDVVDYFVIGSERTRVGVIQYSSSVNIEFHLNQYSDKSSLQQAIANINYLGAGTQTEKALDVMVDESFQEENGARGIGIPRVAVVLTDGQSQGPNRVRVPADRAREIDIAIFAIGVTSNVNEAELVAIANTPSDTFVFQVDDFDAIPTIGATLQDTACDQPAMLLKDIEFNITVGENQTQNFAQVISQEGTTISLQATEGILNMYGSATTTNPNSALNDFHLIAVAGHGAEEIFIGPEFFNRSISDGGGRSRRQVTNQNDTEANIDQIGTVYISIEGKQATNAFSLVTAEGDVTEPETNQPAATQPKYTQPETTQPETTQPETTQPETTQPDTTQPETTQPETTQPESTQPESTHPESTQPESTQPESTQPESTQPESNQSEATQPKANQTETTKVETTKPGNGGGTVFTTVPYIVLIMLTGVIIARLAN